MATLVAGFESLGQGGPSLAVSAALIATGLVSGALYYWHSRHHPDPILDLSLLKIHTFRVSTIAGNLCRFGVGAVPYLLALMLQIGFGLSALSAGLITFAGAVGALAMKIAAPRILDRWGYRRVLTVNAIFTGASLACCAFLRRVCPVDSKSAVQNLSAPAGDTSQKRPTKNQPKKRKMNTLKSQIVRIIELSANTNQTCITLSPEYGWNVSCIPSDREDDAVEIITKEGLNEWADGNAWDDAQFALAAEFITDNLGDWLSEDLDQSERDALIAHI
jgi:hypothetical protein